MRPTALLVRAALSGLAALLTLAALSSPAGGQDGDLEVRIREADLERDGATRVVVSVGGEQAGEAVLPATGFQVAEEGRPVEGLAVEPVLESETRPVTVVLVMDVSGSTEGEPLAAAKAAARSFAEDLLARGVHVGVVAFGPTAEVRAGLTGDRDAVLAAVDGLAAGGETALYDGVATATGLLAEDAGLGHIVVFSDGADTASTATLEESVAAAEAVEAAVTSVVLATSDTDEQALARLAGKTGGRTLPVGEVRGLAGAFQQVVREIASQYVLTYRAGEAGPEELELTVTVTAGGASASDRIAVLNPRQPAVVAPPELPGVEVPQPTVDLFASPTGLMVGAGAAFLSLLLLLVVLLWRPGQGRAARVLTRGMEIYERGRDRGRHRELPTADVTRRAVELMDRVPRPEGLEERLQVALDRAAWSMRTNEFLLLALASGMLGGLVGFGLLGHLPAALVLALLGGAVPVLVLRQRISSRQAAFMDQLPDTLQLLAGSLRAGYGILQALDTVVQEAEPPTSPEFSRVLTEARLGMPLDEALEGMAERLGSEDFRWVVMAITIQRQIGGNLAALLSTVAETMRGRAQVRRQVKTLSAEGRISAVIIALMPFILAGALMVINPGYLLSLFAEPIGRVLLIAAGGLMVAGFIWLRRIIAIEV